MTDDTERAIAGSELDPNLKVQDAAIIEAFAVLDHEVVTSTEIHEHVDLSQKQVRRRLDDLADRGIVESRKPGRDRLWWLVADVREPITVQYPLLRYVRDHISVQFLLLGLCIGVVAVLFTLIGLLTTPTGPASRTGTHLQLFRAGVTAAIVSGGFLVSACLAAIAEWLGRRATGGVPGITGE